MRTPYRFSGTISVAARTVGTALLLAAPVHGQSTPTIEQMLSPASPLEVRAAHHADRIAWITYDRGMRNIYTAVAPAFVPVRLTRFLKDDGVDMTDVILSDDGNTIVFVRGSDPNRAGWVANPSHDPAGGERAIWAVRATGGPAWRVAAGSSPQLSPDGHYVLFVKDSQIYRAAVTPTRPAAAIDRGEKPFISAWGQQNAPRWSPDSRKIAFVSVRQNHALIAVYDDNTHGVSYLAPSVDFDGSPTWSADGKSIAFTRRPGTPFGQQTQAGSGGIGNPQGVAAATQAANAARGGGVPAQNGRGAGAAPAQNGGRGGRGGADSTARNQQPAGLFQARFRGGYTLSVMVADVATGTAREVWHNAANERLFTNINNIRWVGNHLAFPMSPAMDEWDRYFALPIDGSTAPSILTTTDGLIEDATAAAYSADGKTLYYCTNASDIERRHIWAVPTAGGTPRRVSTGDGIETYPAPLASGKYVAVLYADAKHPQSLAIVPATGGAPRVITSLPADFPMARQVVPQVVTYHAPDSLEIHGQLFLPPDLKPGEHRPTMIFVHGGPQRQMMPGYHYFQFYHWAYAVDQWLAMQGYVVLSINYRSGVGYGRKFRNADKVNARGNSEYQDVLAGAKYLQSRSDVDPKRIGIWGLSYGGLLTSQALARNSDIFIAGADLAGVHLYGSTLDSSALSYQSSAISQIDKWKSPVFLEQGDDDRNVDFAQMVGLVQLLRPRDIYYELTVIPDDVHESLIHARWVDVFTRMGAFLHRFVWNAEPPPHVIEVK